MTTRKGSGLADAVTQALNTQIGSGTYAREIATPEFGAGLDGVIRSRGTDVSGILNGIDTEVWDPATDPLIAHPIRPKTLCPCQRPAW